MQKKEELKFYDVRVLDKYLEQEVIKREDYQKFIKSLADDSANAVTVNFEELDPPPLQAVESEE